MRVHYRHPQRRPSINLDALAAALRCRSCGADAVIDGRIGLHYVGCRRAAAMRPDGWLTTGG